MGLGEGQDIARSSLPSPASLGSFSRSRLLPSQRDSEPERRGSAGGAQPGPQSP